MDFIIRIPATLPLAAAAVKFLRAGPSLQTLRLLYGCFQCLDPGLISLPCLVGPSAVITAMPFSSDEPKEDDQTSGFKRPQWNSESVSRATL